MSAAAVFADVTGATHVSDLETRLAVAQAEGLEANVRRTLAFVGVVGAIELQALAVRKRVGDKYADNRAAHARTVDEAIRLCAEANKWISDGCFLIPAELQPGVETRHVVPGQWFDMGKGSSTTDNDVARRLAFGVDCDVKRPRAISATDAQMALSVEMASSVRAYLVDIVGDSTLAYVHSGNGRQLWCALDALKADADLKLLLSSILVGLDAKFSEPERVEVDLTLCDHKRLLPACGTTKKKGAPGIAERPHRSTAIVTPRDVRRLGLDELRELHARIWQDCDDAGRTAMDKAMGVRPSLKSTSAPRERRPSDDSPWERANALDVERVAEWLDLYDSGDLRCPGCGTCGDSSVALVNGGLKCLHDRCSSKGPPGKPGFRTVIDLTMEVRNVELVEAYGLLAERFGLEPLMRRMSVQGGGPGRESWEDGPPPGWADAEPGTQDAGPNPANETPEPRPTLASRARCWPKAPSLSPLTTGHPTLDAACRGGFVAPRLIIIGGAPGAAKTTTSVGIGVRAALMGHPVAILACDEDIDDVLQRVGQIHGIERVELEQRQFDACERLAQALEQLPNLEIFDGDEDTVESALEWLAAHPAEGKAGVLIADSAQTIRTSRSDGFESPRERVDDVMKTIKRATRTQRLVSIVTSEIGRAFYRSAKTLADLNDLAAFKESGGIEYAAKTCLLMRNTAGADDMFDVGMPKNRGGKKRVFRLRIDLATTLLSEVAIPAEEMETETTTEARRGEAKDRARAKNAEKALRTITANPGIGSRKLRDKCNLGPDALGPAVELLIEQGRVENRPEQHGKREDAHYFAVVRPAVRGRYADED